MYICTMYATFNGTHTMLASNDFLSSSTIYQNVHYNTITPRCYFLPGPTTTAD